MLLKACTLVSYNLSELCYLCLMDVHANINHVHCKEGFRIKQRKCDRNFLKYSQV